MEMTLQGKIIDWMIPKEHKEISKTITKLHAEIGEIRKAVSIKEQAAKITDDTLYYAGKAKGFADRVYRDDKFEIYKSRFAENSVVDCHSHPEDEIFLIIEGNVIITVDNIDYNLKANSELVVKADHMHCLRFVEHTVLYTIAIPPLKEFTDGK